MGALALELNREISTVSFNTYLAALCELVINDQRGKAQKQVTVRTANSCADSLDRAWQWLRDPEETYSTLAVKLDAVSYATVIQAAAAGGNRTLVDLIWQEMMEREIQPNIVAYNARLRSLAGRTGAADDAVLKVWDEEIKPNPELQPDKYSIDLLLLPLIRAGRVGDVENLLDNFAQRKSDREVSMSFTAFLQTIVRGGELSTARALFETYILSTLSPVIVGHAGAMRMVRPVVRHFNILLEGYRRQFAMDAWKQTSSLSEERELAHEEGWALYRLLLQSRGVCPDSYTITSMMGLCRNSTELSNLICEASTDLDIELSSVVLRAACKFNRFSLEEAISSRLSYLSCLAALQ
jgi:pentatricopeptide repeat protein